MIDSRTVLTNERVRELCIRMEWYTHGNSREYQKMLDSSNIDGVEDSDLESIAEDIVKHSDPECFTGADDEVCLVMWYLRNEACVTFYERKGE